jgi:hypothetical protein
MRAAARVRREQALSGTCVEWCFPRFARLRESLQDDLLIACTAMRIGAEVVTQTRLIFVSSAGICATTA